MDAVNSLNVADSLITHLIECGTHKVSYDVAEYLLKEVQKIIRTTSEQLEVENRK